MYVSDAYHSDIADAVLYAFRESLHWVSETIDQPIAKYGTDAWVKEQERQILEQLEHELREKGDDEFLEPQGFDD